jgi:hypothetical protein
VATNTLTPSEPQTERDIANLYAETLVYKALIEAEEPLKASEIVRAIGRPDFDLRLARVVLITSSYFTALERKWTLWSRYLDTSNTFDHILRRTLNTYGRAIDTEHLARELETVYNRPRYIYEEMLERLGEQDTAYFLLDGSAIAPTAWLLNIEPTLPYSGEDEILFENFLTDEECLPHVALAEQVGLSQESADSMVQFLEAVGVPVRPKAIQFLAWKRDPDSFDARAFFTTLSQAEGVVTLVDGTVICATLASKLGSHFPAIAEQEVSDATDVEAQEAQPLTLSESERDQLVSAIQEREGTTYAHVLLEDIFEVTSDYVTYASDLETLIAALTDDERVVWLGGDRFRPQGTLPGYIFSVPALFEFPETPYTDVEGNLVDLILEVEGFDGGLERDILNPLAQDVLDEEAVSAVDTNPPTNARTIIKYHHKQIGTLPLCQFPSGFFPTEPSILETEFVLPSGQHVSVWVNNETRLLYGLYDWFQAIPIDSGAVFSLERQASDRYVVNFNDESEPSMFVSRNRTNELLALSQRAEDESISTFDVVREIMEHSRKGLEFLTLLTEVNIVRRTSRHLLASLLSEYHCFFQRGGAWVYDPKKLSQGFNKSKRKYLLR